MFPYFHFVRGRLEDTDDGKELLTLRFSSDTVEIRGKQLEPLLKALDDFSLAWGPRASTSLCVPRSGRLRRGDDD